MAKGVLTSEDRVLMDSLWGTSEDYKNNSLIFIICNRLSNRDLVKSVFVHYKLLFIIESSKQKAIGFKYKPHEWIAFANNSINITAIIGNI